MSAEKENTYSPNTRIGQHGLTAQLSQRLQRFAQRHRWASLPCRGWDEGVSVKVRVRLRLEAPARRWRLQAPRQTRP